MATKDNWRLLYLSVKVIAFYTQSFAKIQPSQRTNSDIDHKCVCCLPHRPPLIPQ